LTDGEKIEEIMYSLDEDGDGLAGPWEMHDWIIWVDNVFYQHVVNEQWQNLVSPTAATPDSKEDRDEAVLAWSDYQAKVHPHGIRKGDERRHEVSDRRRWNHADSDGDGVLNKREFKLFVFPHLAGDGGANGILVKEAHEELDSDHNGRVSQAEFMSQFHLSPEEEKRDAGR